MLLNILPNIILIVIFILYFWDLRSIINFEVTSSTFLPLMTVVIIFILNTIEIIRKVLNKKWQIKKMFKKSDRYLLLLGFLVWVYIWSLPKLGFVVSSALAIFVFSILWIKTRKNINSKKLIIAVLISIGFPVSIAYFFEQILKINLP